ncbi:uncharacterized protein LOC119685938 [Teleopsis dalmanni]|uniref:uncharacterized protein LOC119685938 n=1 Tax=Teleopsis dalmanni TaxID=139649 RepID=UPI0018CF8D8E|nr:uncharacterized protein LOC119685938 [Teleopsis dalmanni]
MRSTEFIVLSIFLTAAIGAAMAKDMEFAEKMAKKLKVNIEDCKLLSEQKNKNGNKNVLGVPSSGKSVAMNCPSYCFAEQFGFMKNEAVNSLELEKKLNEFQVGKESAKQAAAKCGPVYTGDKCSTADQLFKCLATSVQETKTNINH